MRPARVTTRGEPTPAHTPYAPALAPGLASIPSGSHTTPWTHTLGNLRRTLGTWAFFVLFLALFRVVFVGVFADRVEAGCPPEAYVKALLHGLRFDLRETAAWVALPLLATLLTTRARAGVWVALPQRLCRWSAVCYCLATSLLAAVALGYYHEFDEPFSSRVFGIVYDDTMHVVDMIVSDFHGVGWLLAALVTTGLAVGAFQGWQRLSLPWLWRWSDARQPAWVRACGVVVLAAAVVGGARGSFGRRPAMRKWSAVTSSDLLNDSVLNPYAALRYALLDHLRMRRAGGLRRFVSEATIRQAAQRGFQTERTLPSLDDYTRRHARGAHRPRPEHVFVIVMESYDAWPLQARYAHLGLAENLKELARRGLHVERFVASSNTTMAALAAIITGMPDAGVYVSRHPRSAQAYPSSLGLLFGRLGYRTRAFYAGMTSWQRFGEFCRAQGFEQVYGSSDIHAASGTRGWGVQDDQLFDFVLAKTAPGEPSLSIVLTMTFHPPYDIDVQAAGYPLEQVRRQIADTSARGADLRVLGHLWYADRALGKFVAAAHERYPGALFVLTGDHYGRRFPGTPSAEERSLVPLVLYGDSFLEGLQLAQGVAGSHIDIVPTLVELVAEPGFAYNAFGQDLLAPQHPSVGYGKRQIVADELLYDVSARRLHVREGRVTETDVESLLSRHRALHGLAWWRVMRGGPLDPLPDNG